MEAAGSIQSQRSEPEVEVAVAVAGLVMPCVQCIWAGAAGGACERRRPGRELLQKLEPEIAGLAAALIASKLEAGGVATILKTI